MARCGPIPFCGLLIMTVWGTVLLNGGTWLTATLLGILTCSLVMVWMTARLLINEHRLETRVWVSSDFVNDVEITAPTIQGVVAQTGENVVLGMPVNLNIQNTVVVLMNFP